MRRMGAAECAGDIRPKEKETRKYFSVANGASFFLFILAALMRWQRGGPAPGCAVADSPAP